MAAISTQSTLLSAMPIGSRVLKGPKLQCGPPSPDAPSTVTPRTPIILKASFMRACCASDA